LVWRKRRRRKDPRWADHRGSEAAVARDDDALFEKVINRVAKGLLKRRRETTRRAVTQVGSIG
jgi:hypothetical protein